MIIDLKNKMELIVAFYLIYFKCFVLGLDLKKANPKN